jgi:hypothetical protein
MSFLDRVEYNVNASFTQEQLGGLTPDKLMLWFNHVTYGMSEPPTGHDMNPLVQSQTLMYWKKALSSFMPNRLMVWNEISGVGNPTRSIALNNLIKCVKRKEVRGQGAPSMARRSIKEAEFHRVIELLKGSEGIIKKYGIPAMMVFQFHMIARIDDSTQVTIANLCPHDHFTFCLKARMNWSKNVLEERDAPFQAVIASRDHTYCLHLALALWLEVYVETNPTALLTPYLFAFSEDTRVPQGGLKAKTMAQQVFNSAIFNRPEFYETGNLGSHSVRKYASTHSRKCGASKDEKELRGHWKKGSQRVSDVYDDVELPYPDAKVAGLLCVGGPCKYIMREDSGVTDQFILEYVTVKARTRVGDQVALVLGKALLWYIFDPEGEDDVPTVVKQRVQNAYSHIQVLPEGTNPVKKVPIVITGHEGEVYMDEIPDSNGDNTHDNNNNNAVGGSFVDRPIREQLLAVHSQLMSLRHSNEELRDSLQQDRIDQTRQYQILNSNLRRIALQPARRRDDAANPNVANGNGNNNAHQPPEGVATLSPNPRNLFVLWDEYTHGIGGRKAAQAFTPHERGRAKHKYTRRKVAWDCIARLVRSGVDANVAIDRIYRVYGEGTTVTTIINRLRVDRNNNSLAPSLL